MQMMCLHSLSQSRADLRPVRRRMLWVLHLLTERLLSPKRQQDSSQQAEPITCSSGGHCPEGGQSQLDDREMLLVTSEGGTGGHFPERGQKMGSRESPMNIPSRTERNYTSEPSPGTQLMENGAVPRHFRVPVASLHTWVGCLSLSFGKTTNSPKGPKQSPQPRGPHP